MNTREELQGRLRGIRKRDVYQGMTIFLPEALTDHPGYRLRVGDWRIVSTVNDNELLIHVINVKTRGEVDK